MYRLISQTSGKNAKELIDLSSEDIPKVFSRMVKLSKKQSIEASLITHLPTTKIQGLFMHGVYRLIVFNFNRVELYEKVS